MPTTPQNPAYVPVPADIVAAEIRSQTSKLYDIDMCENDIHIIPKNGPVVCPCQTD